MERFYYNLHAFDTQNCIRQEIAALLLKIVTIILKLHFFEKSYLVPTIHWHKWKDMLLPFVNAKNLFQG